jgi:hypothetical protein
LPERGNDLLTCEVGRTDLMWCVRHDLLAVEDASLDEPANLMMTDTELCRCIAQCQPLAVLLGGAVAVDAAQRPWCRGFHAAMQLRMLDWAPLLDTGNGDHGLLLPILLHCRDDQGRPLLGPTRKGREARELLRNAHTDIPAVVEAMRQYWMPIRYARAG